MWLGQLRVWPWISAVALRGIRLDLSDEERSAIKESSPVTPMTALIIDADGLLTYMGENGCRRQIVGDHQLLVRLRKLQDQDSDDCDDNPQH